MSIAKRKVDECVRRMERSDKQVDVLVVKLDRRTKLFDEERKMWYKEFLTLKELIRRSGFADVTVIKALEGNRVQPHVLSGAERLCCCFDGFAFIGCFQEKNLIAHDIVMLTQALQLTWPPV